MIYDRGTSSKRYTSVSCGLQCGSIYSPGIKMRSTKALILGLKVRRLGLLVGWCIVEVFLNFLV
jgi:hypothetical protein